MYWSKVLCTNGPNSTNPVLHTLQGLVGLRKDRVPSWNDFILFSTGQVIHCSNLGHNHTGVGLLAPYHPYHPSVFEYPASQIQAQVDVCLLMSEIVYKVKHLSNRMQAGSEAQILTFVGALALS